MSVSASLDPARGRLVVATPDLQDPNFESTVVLLLEHGPGGALGVVLNRPSPLPVSEAMASGPAEGPSSSWSLLATDPDVVFVGGPVQPNAVIALARSGAVSDPARWEPVFDDVGVINLGHGPVPEVGDLKRLRVFAGYAGWGPDQLETEIEAGSWFVVEALPEDGFSPAPEALWREVLVRQGGLFTTVTTDPSLN